MLEILAALAPSLFVALLFWWVIRSMLNGDRREREALAKLDAREGRRPTAGREPAHEPDVHEPDNQGRDVSDPDSGPSHDPRDLRKSDGPGAGGTGGVR